MPKKKQKRSNNRRNLIELRFAKPSTPFHLGVFLVLPIGWEQCVPLTGRNGGIFGGYAPPWTRIDMRRRLRQDGHAGHNGHGGQAGHGGHSGHYGHGSNDSNRSRSIQSSCCTRTRCTSVYIGVLRVRQIIALGIQG